MRAAGWNVVILELTVLLGLDFTVMSTKLELMLKQLNALRICNFFVDWGDLYESEIFHVYFYVMYNPGYT